MSATLESDSPTFLVAGIPGGYEWYRFECRLRSTREGNASDAVRFRLGEGSVEDGPFRYFYFVDQDAFSSASSLAAAFMQMGRCNAALAQAGQFSLLELRSFPETVAWGNFRSSGTDRFMPFASVAKEGHSDVLSAGLGGWRVFSGRLERMQVFMQNGDVMAGSTVTVFGSVSGL